MITHKIPHNARFISKSSGFTGFFNTPIVGKYSFNIPQNLGHVVTKLQPGTIYFIDSMQVAGNLAPELYSMAINDRPNIILKKSLTGQTVYPEPLYLMNYTENRNITAFVETNKNDENLIVDCYGVLNQINDIVGIDSVKITINFSIYAMDSKEYNSSFRDKIDSSFGKR